MGVREVKEGRKKPSVSVFYIDPTGVKGSSPDAASADNVLVPTKRTYVDDDPLFLTARRHV